MAPEAKPKAKQSEPGKGYVRARDCVAVIIKLLAVSRRRPSDGALVASLRPAQVQIAKTLGVATNDRAIRWEFDHVETQTDARGVAVLLRAPRVDRKWRGRVYPDNDRPLTPELEARIMTLLAEGHRNKYVAYNLECSRHLVMRVKQAHKLYAAKLISPEERDQILKGTSGAGQY